MLTSRIVGLLVAMWLSFGLFSYIALRYGKFSLLSAYMVAVVFIINLSVTIFCYRVFFFMPWGL